MAYYLIHELPSRPDLVVVSEMRASPRDLFLIGRSRGVVAESIRVTRGVDSPWPIFYRPKWRSRCGVDSEIWLRRSGASG